MLKGSVASRGLRPLEDLFQGGVTGDLSDGELLERFLRDNHSVGEAAFRSLVERHGPMVYRVCVQSLRDHHLAQDAVQATFLILARQAGSIRKWTSVTSWLFGVARRAAARVRVEEARRKQVEQRRAEQFALAMTVRRDSADPDHFVQLHAEIERLPERYRAPILLCYFEGLTHEQAARRLVWPVGTVKTRLSRGRDRLRVRLEGQHLPALAWLPATLVPPASDPALAEQLVKTIAMAASGLAASHDAPGSVSLTVVSVAQGVIRAMMFHKIRWTAAVLLGPVFLSLGALVAGQQLSGKSGAGPVHEMEKPAESGTDSVVKLVGTTEYDPDRVTEVHAPVKSRVERVLVSVGTSVRLGDPLVELFSPDLAEAKSKYEMAFSEWSRAKRVLDYKVPLAKEKAVAGKLVLELENDEAESRLSMKLAKDRLLAYELTEKEIGNVTNEVGQQKARFILRSRTSGVVVARSANPGSIYDTSDKLMTIVSLDHLWVRGNVSKQDVERVKLGQDVKVLVPFSHREIDTKLTYIDLTTDPHSRASQFRVTVPNVDGQLKARMLVRLEVNTGLNNGGNERQVTGHRSPAERSVELSTSQRLNELERKVNRLLDEKETRSTNQSVLDRLDSLERKVDSIGKHQ